MVNARLAPALCTVAVSFILAFLSLRGVIEDPVGHRSETVAVVINTMVEQFGNVEAAGIFAGISLVLGGATLLLSRR